MGDLRDKYKNKSMKVKDLKNQVDAENTIVGGNGGNGDFLKIKEDGKTVKIRLFPAHDGKEFLVLRKQHWISIEGDDGKPARRTVLNANIHGNKKQDVIDAYIKYCSDNLKDKEKLDKVVGRDGLNGSNEWIAYAAKIAGEEKQFGRVELKKTVRDAINKATFIEDEDEPIEIDPFTDIDEGLPLLIKYLAKPNKKKGEDYYTVSSGKKAIPMDDDDLDKFDKAKPLKELYNDVYTLSMFELALEGLKYFDAENEIDFFEDDEWLAIVKKIKAQFKDAPSKKSSKKTEDDKDEDEEEEKPKKKTAKKVVDEDDEEEEEEKPKKKASKKVVEEDEDDEEEDDEEEDDEEEEEEEKPKKKVVKKVVDEDDEEEEEEKPKKKVAAKKVVEEDEDDEDEEEEKPKKRMSMDDIKKRLGKK